jgi:hypothetical protein
MLLVATLIALGTLSACETSETISAASIIESIPEVIQVATLDTLSKADAELVRGKLELRYKRALYAGVIVPVYWRDDLKADMVLFTPAAGSRLETIKVGISGWRRYHVTSGTRNGRPFHTEGLVPDSE